MKLRTSILVLILATTTQASQKLDVLVHYNGNVPLTVLGPAESFAARILASADITLTWHTNSSSARKDPNRMIVLDLQENAAAAESKGALGYSLLCEGVHAVIFYDRIRRVATENQQPYVLAHAMAHEIAHLLQGVRRHSTTGVMKAHWDQRDIFEMRHLLVFTPEDIRMIRNVKESSCLSGSEVY
jgi:hypothetical protein